MVDNMAKTVEERVCDIVVEQLGVNPEQVSMEASFVNDLGVDSLDDVEVVMAIEKEFGITIPDEIAKNLVTVGLVVEYIRTLQVNEFGGNP